MLRRIATIATKRAFSASPVLAQFEFSDKAKVQSILDKYPEKRGAVNPLLHLAQVENDGWLSTDAMQQIGKICEVPDNVVYECAHFYALFNTDPVGRFQVHVCVTTPCMISGGDDVLHAIEQHLGVGVGETTPDGLFTLGEMECMGCCVNAPMMAVADFSDSESFTYEYYEDLHPMTAIEILEAHKRGQKPAGGSQIGRTSCEPRTGKTTLLDSE